MKLSDSIGRVPKVGPAYVKRLSKLGVKTIYDLFFHFPHRYEDFSNLKKISQLKINETASIQGEILTIKNQVTFRKRVVLTKAVIKDETGVIQATWFNQPYLIQSLKQGDSVCLAGRISLGKEGVYLSNPIYEKVWPTHDLIHTGRIIPIYPEMRGVSSRWLRFIIKPLLEVFRSQIPESLPAELIKQNKLLPIEKAIQEIHFPSSLKMAEQAKKRFAFEELFLLELFVLNKKQELSRLKTTPIPINLEAIQKFVKALPYKLTDAQRKSAWQILKDIEKDKPMTRLLQGDVGSGKTVVAALVALNVIRASNQIAFMAPTEILSKQHFETFASLLKNLNVNIGLLTYKTDKFITKKLKRQVIEISRIKLLEKTRGKINPNTKKVGVGVDVLIGTHALIQDKVKFHKLGLVIVDEQHRFGVEQRAKLCQQKNGKEQQALIPHLLSMTATPIPRTLALTVYGDLDLSLIDEMPKGKRKVKTLLVPQKDREKTYQLIKEEIKKGRQIFVICPRIEERELDEGEEDKTGWSEVKAVKAEYERLSKDVFPQFRLAMLHGKMPTLKKAQIMKEFKNEKIDILVSTSVIEVGIDIPNATVMLIEGAERFGLSQLHQFRGRIGRKGDQSYCFLFYNSRSKNARARLKALAKIDNGLELAEKDLKIRGPGQFLGTKQWGIPDIAMNALDDFSLVEKTRQAAKGILATDPELKKFPALKQRLNKFTQIIHLE
jgi:ATP-dependent DNA helicase RecG